MAKISDLSAIDLSCLTDDDIFYIVDFEGKPVSKNITYQVLKQGIDRDIEKVQIIKGCSYNKETKVLELSVGLSDGSMKVLSIDMDDLNIYHAGDGLSTLQGDDNTFIVDWSKVSEVGHKHLESDITDFGSYLSSSEKYLTANALDSVSSNWDTAYSRVSSATDGLTGNVGTLAYKNEISASEVCGYTDTTYSVTGSGLKMNETVISLDYSEICSSIDISSYSKTDTKYSNGFGLSANGTEFGVDTDKIALTEHNHNDSYYRKNETSCVSELNSKFGEFKDLSKKNLSEIVDNNTVKVVGDKLSCVVHGSTSDASTVWMRQWN